MKTGSAAETTAEWQLAYVLPNLVLPKDPQPNAVGEWPDGLTLGTEHLVIAAGTDPRVRELRATQPVVEQILGAFRDLGGRPYAPAVLLVRGSAPEALRTNPQAMVAFRNSVALSIILRGRAAEARGYGGKTPTWSDTFDFHPVQIGRKGHAVLASPAVTMVMTATATLRLGPSPYVHVDGQRTWLDEYLYRVFGREWSRRFTGAARDERFSRTLFRSLELAYQACAVGAKNEDSIHDYGVQVSLWVSAMEILAWPTNRHANRDAVLNLVGRVPLRSELARRRYRVKLSKTGPPRTLNALERAYVYLNVSRNRFLHGAPVSPSTLFTRRRGTPVGVPRLAAVMYRAALVAYLSARYPISVSSLSLSNLREALGGYDYEQALAELFGIDL